MESTVGLFLSIRLNNMSLLTQCFVGMIALAMASGAPQQRQAYNFAPTPEAAAAHAAPHYASADPNYKVPAILDSHREVDAGGNYQFSFDTENGIHALEKSVQKSVRDEKNEEHQVPSKEGSYSYVGPDGQQYTVTYVADENGFRASGAHLPVAPEIPAEIQRSLDILAQTQQA